MLNYISYGGGVQSTAMVLMAIDGIIERPDLVVFADTGSEMPETYSTVSSIQKICEENNLPFYEVKAMTKSIDGQALHSWYMEKNAIPMIGIRWCTGKWKVDPVRQFVKSKALEYGFTKKPLQNAWLGITSDEKSRATGYSDVKYQIVTYPLLHKSRRELISWIDKNYPELSVSKSGCFCCPYANSDHWINLRKKHASLFETALEMERIAKKRGIKRGLYRTKSIDVFNYSHQLTDFGFEIEESDTGCDSWSCFT
tara:strand:- start:100 stop:864 length:765 start_codon:yes stop_codon:yes gene_type:complete